MRMILYFSVYTAGARMAKRSKMPGSIITSRQLFLFACVCMGHLGCWEFVFNSFITIFKLGTCWLSEVLILNNFQVELCVYGRFGHEDCAD